MVEGCYFVIVLFYTEIKVKRNNTISEIITFRVTKAKAKVNLGGEVSMWT